MVVVVNISLFAVPDVAHIGCCRSTAMIIDSGQSVSNTHSEVTNSATSYCALFACGIFVVLFLD